MKHLRALLAAYPDACIVQTHRDPLRIIASLVYSFAQLAAALPNLAASPPAFLDDVQAWFDRHLMTGAAT
jgi:hypothetical protein